VRIQFSPKANKGHGCLEWLSLLVELVEEPLEQPLIPGEQVDHVERGTQHIDLKS
jgi:hypothetical protein